MAERASGVLLHVTSIPGGDSSGSLGRGALEWLDWLSSAGQSLWQILPLGPVGPSGSPYDAESSFAGNAMLIDARELVDMGLIEAGRMAAPSAAAEGARDHLFRLACQALSESDPAGDLAAGLRRWSNASEQQTWLPDWCLFKALKLHLKGQSWTRWPDELRRRDSAAITAARRELGAEIRYQEFLQYLFFRQLDRIRRRAADLGIRLVGDLPFYVALDSCDVWVHPHLFDLDESGSPISIGGVPPDYFSATGQRWGNPVYRWERHREENFRWWVDRIAYQLRQVDILRLDHFRGFAAHWEIPAHETTATGGYWRPGPGLEIFTAIEERLGALPLIAEDLGHITPDVEELRLRLGLPGMRVLQFAFDGSDSVHLPHNLTRDRVLYTGTHDNDTCRGWFDTADAGARQRALDYLGATEETFAWELLRAAQVSVADWVIAPIQDIFDLDGAHRMNTPGTAVGNWRWRLPDSLLDEGVADRLRRLTEVTARVPELRDGSVEH